MKITPKGDNGETKNLKTSQKKIKNNKKVVDNKNWDDNIRDVAK